VGLDSVFQAAGRCNRHGEFGESKALLEQYRAADDIAVKRALLRKLERYGVSLYKY
jgi:CRISPR/Cas system-associated endonuclease/helicase Cas3